MHIKVDKTVLLLLAFIMFFFFLLHSPIMTQYYPPPPRRFMVPLKSSFYLLSVYYMHGYHEYAHTVISSYTIIIIIALYNSLIGL
jgi:hypothetical protein